MSLGRPRVLIVDDYPDVAQSLAILFNACGAETKAMTDPLQVVEAFATFRPQLIITDLRMPRMSGLELCGAIRLLPGGNAPVIVALSGEFDDSLQEKVIAAGANHYVVKPAKHDFLIALLRALPEDTERPQSTRPERNSPHFSRVVVPAKVDDL